MPIFEYLCKDCGALLEVFLQSSDAHPRLCGYRCPLGPDSGHAARGFGQLTRQISAVNAVKHPHVRRDVPNVAPELAASTTALYAELAEVAQQELA